MLLSAMFLTTNQFFLIMQRLKSIITRFIISILRLLPPEASSLISLKSINFLYSLNENILKSNINKRKKKSITFRGLSFSHPLGLAAGFDKEGKYFHALGSIGFSFVEVGTFTPKPQKGNDKPRIKRILEHNSLINRLGFNNPGIDAGLINIKYLKKNYAGVLGISIGKNKFTSLDDAHRDYVFCLRKSYELADYIAINISSPNTKDLRQLSSKDYIDSLLKNLFEELEKLVKTHKKIVPIFLKLSPDENSAELKRIINVSIERGVAGFIISNSMAGNYQNIQGGISGELLRERSIEALKIANSIITKKHLLISSGGISRKSDLEERLDNGASLAQIYTGFVYKGPSILEELLN